MTSLWEFAVERYGRPGVAACCLALQDQLGADVNLLLTAAWLARQGRRWGEGEIEALQHHCADWREHCLLPLRRVRWFVRGPAGDTALYGQLKAAELAAERHQLAMIEGWLATAGLPEAAAAGELLRVNLAAYLSRYGAAADVERLAELLEGMG